MCAIACNTQALCVVTRSSSLRRICAQKTPTPTSISCRPPTAAHVIRPHYSCVASRAHSAAPSGRITRGRVTPSGVIRTRCMFPAVPTQPLIIASNSNTLDLFLRVCLHGSCQHAVKWSDFYCPYTTTGGIFSAPPLSFTGLVPQDGRCLTKAAAEMNYLSGCSSC